MSEFYTSAIKYGNSVLVRGYKDGIQFKEKVKFEPTLYVTNNKESEYKSLDGVSLKEINFESISEAKSFIEKYQDVEGFKVYGNPAWQYQYISDKYTKEVHWDISKIRTFTIDIETTTEHGGFPDINNPSVHHLCAQSKNFVTNRNAIVLTKA